MGSRDWARGSDMRIGVRQGTQMCCWGRAGDSDAVVGVGQGAQMRM